MRRRSPVAELAIVMVVTIATATLLFSFFPATRGEADPTPSASSPVERSGSQGLSTATRLAANVPRQEPTMVVQVASAVPSSQPKSASDSPTEIPATPPPDLNFLNERALAYTLERVTILSGEPEVVFAQMMSASDVQEIGIHAPVFEIGCPAEYYIVIVQGDLDVRNEFLAPVAADVGMPVRYLLFMYYVSHDGPLLVGLTGSPEGIGLGELLNDPSLPELPAGPGDHVSPTDDTPLPCHSVEQPGMSEEDIER